MIKFIVYDDEVRFRKIVCSSIDKVMMGNDSDYKIEQFEKYDENFQKIIELDMCSKIYLLDIEVENSMSGIDVARKIRRDDWNSIIIMITSHSELTYQALKAQIMLLDFICKYDNCKENLENTLKTAIKQVDRKKVIMIGSNNISHRVFIDDIVYILKDTVDRKCIIKTTYSDIPINKNMSEMMELLDERFFLSHRSCLVNTEKILNVDWTNNIICFQNGYQTDLLSRDKKKELKEYVGVD